MLLRNDVLLIVVCVCMSPETASLVSNVLQGSRVLRRTYMTVSR